MSILSRLCVIVVLVAPLSLPATSFACGNFGTDDAAVGKVQSSWGPAETAASHGEYAKALKMLETTRQYLSSIDNADTRRCVGQGADIRIASVKAGESYITAHPGDTTGANAAYHNAWVAFPPPHNCP